MKILIVVALFVAMNASADVVGTVTKNGETVALTDEPCRFEPAPALPEVIPVESRRRAMYYKSGSKPMDGCGGLVVIDGEPAAYIRWRDGDSGLLPLRAFKTSRRS